MPLQFSTRIYGQTTKAKLLFKQQQLLVVLAGYYSSVTLLPMLTQRIQEYSVGASEVYSSALAWERVSHKYSN